MLLNILPGSMPEYAQYLAVDSGYAMVTSGGFSSWTYRPEFDISIPVYSPLASKLSSVIDPHSKKSWLVITSQPNIPEEFRNQLTDIASEQPHFLLLDRCSVDPLNVHLRCRDDEVYTYPNILQVKTTVFLNQ